MTTPTTPEAPATARARRITCEHAGQTFTRKTHRTYTHAVVAEVRMIRNAGDPTSGQYSTEAPGRVVTWELGALTWCGRPDLAVSAARKYQARPHLYRNVAIVPVVG